MNLENCVLNYVFITDDVMNSYILNIYTSCAHVYMSMCVYMCTYSMSYRLSLLCKLC